MQLHYSYGDKINDSLKAKVWPFSDVQSKSGAQEPENDILRLISGYIQISGWMEKMDPSDI